MRITPLVASTFRSDGGSMFGLVPKPIWNKRIPADELNRIPQHAHSLLLELDDGRLALVDTGCGDAPRFGERERQLNGLGPGWPLLERLEERGLKPDDIDLVLFTHLHWDHAGGAVAPAAWGRPWTFPNARHVAHRFEWEDALSRDPLLYKSYPVELMEALSRGPADRVVLVDDGAPPVAPGLRLERSGGHTRGHSTIVLEGDRLEVVGAPPSDRPLTLALFAGDVCPTRHHLRMVFQTSYDTYPLDTRRWKRSRLPELARRGGLLLFDHDPDVCGAWIAEDPREEFAVTATLPAPAGA